MRVTLRSRRVQGWRQLGPGDHVSGLVIGEDDGQRPAGLDDDPGVPAAGRRPGSEAMRLVCCRAGPVMLEATQWRLSKCRESPGARSSSCVPAGAGPAGRGGPAAGGPGPGRCRRGGSCPPATAASSRPGLKSSGVIRRRPAAAMPACSQHSRQCPFLTAMTRRQPAHSPRP